MNDLLSLDYLNTFTDLPSALFRDCQPQAIESPEIAIVSESTAQLIGLDPTCMNDELSKKLMAGQGVLNIWQPIAMKYTGHQFGYYNPDLGDGRGLLLAQVKQNDKLWDLHLKGAGQTPFSRQGDGRAVLRSSIREFLCSEAMAALGIPTTRALCVTTSTTPVYREQQETAATLLRVANTHIRFGHFEFCSFTQQHDLLKQLIDYTIEHYDPDLKDHNQRYLAWYERVVDRTAKLIAKWQSVGFNHGVMNTDNMSILGDTFDYGPFAFLDDYEPGYICNHSDHQGRYAFNQQPNIANWNLAVLGQALLPVLEKDDIIAVLETYGERFKRYFIHEMAIKLGITTLPQDRQQEIVDNTFAMLTQCKLDYTRFFRALADVMNTESMTSLRNDALDIARFDDWLSDYRQQLTQHNLGHDESWSSTMKAVNPKYILRNYLAQDVIEAAEQGDFAPLKRLHRVLCSPFAEQPEANVFAQRPPDWGKHMEISCSS